MDHASVTDCEPEITDLVGLVTRADGSLMRGGLRSGEDDHKVLNWTTDGVRERLEEAIRHCHRTAGSVYGRASRSAWPVYVAEVVGAGDARPYRVPPSPRKVTKMEQALRWPLTYLPVGEPSADRSRGALMAWLGAACVPARHRKGWHKRAGMSLATAKRHRSRALAVICLGLIADGVRP